MRTRFRRIAIRRPSSPNDNKIIIEWMHPSGPYEGDWAEYAVNLNTLKKYETPEELKEALDFWTYNNFGYVLNDVWFHIYGDENEKWAVATGQYPEYWPEEMPPKL